MTAVAYVSPKLVARGNFVTRTLGSGVSQTVESATQSGLPGLDNTVSNASMTNG